MNATLYGCFGVSNEIYAFGFSASYYTGLIPYFGLVDGRHFVNDDVRKFGIRCWDSVYQSTSKITSFHKVSTLNCCAPQRMVLVCFDLMHFRLDARWLLATPKSPPFPSTHSYLPRQVWRVQESRSMCLFFFSFLQISGYITMENSKIKVVLDRVGRVIALIHKASSRWDNATYFKHGPQRESPSRIRHNLVFILYWNLQCMELFRSAPNDTVTK